MEWSGDTHALLLMLAAVAAGAATRPSAWRTASRAPPWELAFTTRHGTTSLLPAVPALHAMPHITPKADWMGLARLNALFAAAWTAGAFPQPCDNFTVHGDFPQATAAPNLHQGGNTVAHLFRLSNLLNGLHFFSQVHFKLPTAFGPCLHALRPRLLASSSGVASAARPPSTPS